MYRTAADRKAEAARHRQITDQAVRPTVPLSHCEFDKTRLVLKLASEFFGMPREFFVESHHTGRVVRFVAVQPGDPLWDEDGWDGEQCVYRPAAEEARLRIDHMVIYNQR